MRRRKYKDKQKNGKWFVCLILLIVMSIYSMVFTEKIVKPNMAAIAEVKVKAMITQIVNEAVHDQFVSDAGVLDLLTIKTDNEGNISFVQSNTLAMNQLATGLTQKVQGKYKVTDPMTVSVPMGSILGSQILSQIGPYIELKVLPIGMSKVNFKTEFESTGINQTKYKVFLEMDSQARVLAPFSINNINVQSTILVAEAVIVGEVPNSYINVPKESIMDATNNVE
ncbi:sporulation protein YunB [Sinanaerobacter chloroacetimidivorans]|jgi:sporulation protein YunB|uniref:Sporulation protein YunB n=1 Tax=Sinanaerobacter chloroacetimidivorans TaxID=2818044 RepID=A0A8J8B3D4_9FIRM|nr:sporulation protein YunB [Sinanaerobacter chloroacetimidivorans]MBR0600234.1 sporulation protein YunB [Sinanaerobacter chloroacetimidivorans]